MKYTPPSKKLLLRVVVQSVSLLKRWTNPGFWPTWTHMRISNPQNVPSESKIMTNNSMISSIHNNNNPKTKAFTLFETLCYFWPSQTRQLSSLISHRPRANLGCWPNKEEVGWISTFVGFLRAYCFYWSDFTCCWCFLGAWFCTSLSKVWFLCCCILAFWRLLIHSVLFSLHCACSM